MLIFRFHLELRDFGGRYCSKPQSLLLQNGDDDGANQGGLRGKLKEGACAMLAAAPIYFSARAGVVGVGQESFEQFWSA